MTTEEWREQVAAARPPLSAAQLAILRPLWNTPHTATAPACTTEAAVPDNERRINDERTAV